MISYFIDENNEIKYTSSKTNTVFEGYTRVLYNEKFENPSDWIYLPDERAFVQKPIVPISMSQTRLMVGEELTITAPEGTTMSVQGPGFYGREQTSLLEFSSERKGTYTIKFFLPLHKVTTVSIEVI